MLKQLRKYLESEKKDKAIFDVVMYGSAVKGKLSPADIDIVVIFRQGSLRERLDKISEIKRKLVPLGKKVDVKQIILEEMFSTDFFARSGILLEGISVFANKKFSELLGFKPYTLFWYSLTSLSHTQKVTFNYILAGRNSEGIIKQLGGERLVSGAAKIPIEHSVEFEEVLKLSNVPYKRSDVLETI